MIRQRGSMVGGVLALLVLLIVLYGLFFYAPGWVTCRASWQDSGLHWRFQVLSGCQVSKDGTAWVPSDRYRQVD